MNSNMIKQVQRMQADLEQAMKELQNTVFESVAGNVVHVAMTGDRKVVSVNFDDNFEAHDKDDLEMLQDMIVLACNDLYKQIEDAENKMREEKLGPYASLLQGIKF